MTLRDKLLAAGTNALCLEARCDQSNIARAWQLHLQSDLFGWTIVTWRWGRIGRSLTTKSTAFPSAGDAHRFTRKLLARRESAHKRIGVAYVVVNL